MKHGLLKIRCLFGLTFLSLLLLLDSAQAAAVAANANTLIIQPFNITVQGKTVQRYRIVQPNGTWGYRGIKGKYFDVIVKNATRVPTVLHWHGLIDPNDQDGVPYVTQPLIKPGSQYTYHFLLKQAGTFWLHSHFKFQLQDLMSAPLILSDPQEKIKAHEVILFLSDFSFKSGKELWTKLRKPAKAMQMNMPPMTMPAHSMGADLVDVKYDALLTNYHTLTNPEVVRVQPGEVVRLRIIAGSAATNFFINLGELEGQAIAVDGESILPLSNHQFNLVIGQRMDILVTIPNQEGAYPILAQGEGTSLQTGLILATAHATVPTLPEHAKLTAGAVTMEQEKKLVATYPLPSKPVNRKLMVVLEGDMQNYIWKLNGKVWPDYEPLEVAKGERVEILFINLSGMSHPMHLHGHAFQVVAIDDKSLRGALRDTVLIPAQSTVKIQFDADNPGNWLMHCHVLFHGEGGMMTILNYSGVPLPPNVDSSAKV